MSENHNNRERIKTIQKLNRKIKAPAKPAHNLHLPLLRNKGAATYIISVEC